MRYTLLLVFILTIHVLSAQKHDHIWMYGNEGNHPLTKVTKMIFTSDSFDIEQTDFEGTFDLTSAAISNTKGEFAFYSNGLHIYNKEGHIMDNGDTINGPANSYWYAVEKTGYRARYFILPMSFDTSIYYLIHQKFYEDPPWIEMGTHEIMYSKVDISQNDGLGRVIEKNVPVVKGNRLEQFTAVRHGNGRDWWVVGTHNLEPLVSRFLITPEGVGQPITQVVPSIVIDSTIAANNFCGFTPDGNKFIHYNFVHGIWIYDFDRCTGEVSNPLHIVLPPDNVGWTGFSFEVSANSRYLYAVAKGFTRIMQYDLLADDVQASGDTIAYHDGYLYNGNIVTTFAFLQRAPNGKIYISSGYNTQLHVINNPDLPGAACGFVLRGIELPTWNNQSTPHIPNYRLYDAPGSPCDSLGINAPVSVQEWPEWLRQPCVAYPNPAQEVCTIYLPNWQGEGTLRITDMNGTLTTEQRITRDRTTLWVRHWPAGTYIATVWKEGILFSSQKIVVQN
jgi:hypothetical protein